MLLNFLLEKLAEEHYPEVDTKKCFKFNSMLPGCTKCKDRCPKNAIIFKSNKIELDENLCNKCGICKAICPTQAITIIGTGEEKILRTIKDKNNIVFSCSSKNGIGNLKLNCLNGFHSELLAALFILFKDKKFYFNLSKCGNCQINNNDNLFLTSLNIAEEFVKVLGINPQYEISYKEDELVELSREVISRQELFSLLRKETSNFATQTADSIIGGKGNQLSMRRILLNVIEKSEGLQENVEGEISLFNFWNIEDTCDGCGFCQSICPGHAWKVDKSQGKLIVSHQSGKCYKCGICLKVCAKKAIVKGKFSIDGLNKYSIKNEKELIACSLCKKEFLPSSKEKTHCDICEKKEALRIAISQI